MEMTNMDANAFNFDAMKEAVGGVDPFAKEKNLYAKDERFYTLAKDKDGNGAALIRFLPDSERAMIQKLFKINTTITKNGKKRFVSEFSPSTIGQPCPFQEKWQELWNSGDKEGSKVYGRGTRYVANIKILKDPANPENEGKIFMYEMSGSMRNKIQNAVDPSEQDRTLGAQPKELFNPLAGNSFRLVAKKGSNNQINYESSEVITEVNSIYADVNAALEDIKANTFKLSELLAPDSFMCYEELVKKMAWVEFSEQNSQTLTAEVSTPVAVVAEVTEVAAVAAVPVAAVPVAAVPATVEQSAPPAATAGANLDDLLSGLV